MVGMHRRHPASLLSSFVVVIFVVCLGISGGGKLLENREAARAGTLPDCVILERELEPRFLVSLVTIIGGDSGSERKKARERKTATGKNTSSGVEENWRSRGQQKWGESDKTVALEGRLRSGQQLKKGGRGNKGKGVSRMGELVMYVVLERAKTVTVDEI
jgi:hypothetical protein